MCGKEKAFVWVQQVMGARTVELKLCESCAKKRGLVTDGPKKDFSVTGLLSGLIDGDEKKHEPLAPCPFCGMTQSELRKTGTLGCDRCAVHFRSDIRSWFRKSGIQPEHRGRYPKSLLVRETSKDHLDLLAARLKDAVEREDYETAASIRDELRVLGRVEGA